MKKLYLSVLAVLFLASVQAQATFTIDSENPVKVSVKGASTLHDWEAVASDVSGYPDKLEINFDAVNGISDFNFSVGVESLDGGRGASMNKKIRKALLSVDNPNITYSSASSEISKNADDDSYSIKSTGTLSLAGLDKEVEVVATAIVSDGVLVISGSHPLKMSDFDIEPPTAMFGQIKTRDDITVVFEFRYTAE